MDIVRQPPAAAGRRNATRAHTPLFSENELEPSLAQAVGQRRWMAETNDETVDVVREKEKRLDNLGHGGPWKAVAGLWCACWMWPDRANAPSPAVFASLADELHQRHSALPRALAASLLKQLASVATHRRFFHWMLEFPEVYFDEGGKPLSNAGFDAVLGNPPWDMLRADRGEKPFFRHSWIYRHQGGGRIGLVLPSGFATDHSSAPLRRRLLTHSSVETISGFDNRKAIFPIHRSVRFMICTSTVGFPTSRIACRFGIDDPAMLERIPDAGDRKGDRTHPITLTPALLSALAIPDLRSEADVGILEGIVHRIPRLCDADGWSVRFGRELNATDDRPHFHAGRTGLPVLEGKHIEPFRVHLARTRTRIAEKDATRLLDATATFMRQRLAYRDVASSTNRLSLIAAILPAGVVTTHSLFCLKTRLAGDNQAFLCGMLNSFVANYLVRQVMTTHLGSSTVERLRVPRLPYDAPWFVEVVELTRLLERVASGGAHARPPAGTRRAVLRTERGRLRACAGHISARA